MTEHTWDYCDHCDRAIVLCGRCGNNTCNGGYGEDGKCPECPAAYEHDQNNVGIPEGYVKWATESSNKAYALWLELRKELDCYDKDEARYNELHDILWPRSSL